MNRLLLFRALHPALAKAPLLLRLGLLGLFLLMTIFWIKMLVEAATKEPEQGNSKIAWVLIILLTHGLGALLYYFVRRPQRLQLGAPVSISP